MEPLIQLGRWVRSELFPAVEIDRIDKQVIRGE